MGRPAKRSNKISQALKGNQRAVGNKGGGRKSEYKPEYVEWVEKLTKLGATDIDLADAFGVSEVTINNWKKAHPEFTFALKKGKTLADAEVADKLFKRATGYEHDDTHVALYRGKVILTKLTKHYPPDTTAAIFWLKNRRPADWRDKVEQTQDETAPPPTKVEIVVKDARKDERDAG